MNLVVLVLIVYSTDRTRRSENEKAIEAIFDELMACEDKDKQAADSAWADYIEAAAEFAERTLLEHLTTLAERTQDIELCQPAHLNTIDALLEATMKFDDFIHGVLRELIESCDAEYSRGPPKIKERIQQKADEDYDGKIEKVVDTVRASGILNSINGFVRALFILVQGGPTVPLIIRVKDRISNPLANGYRDVLLNLSIPGCEGLVCELQLHLKAIHDIKPVQHRCYQMLRGAGWDKEEARAHHLARRQAQLDEEVLIEKTKRAIEKLETQDAADIGETPVELLNGNDSDLVLSQSEGEGEGEDQSLSDDAASWGSW
eukprot:CAMPEP_0119511164 /NCGR_PEP_ID=MMETSP1344-20130328/29904_1 /TAXON_ID=236787 /ORGANISM="Florenciella parvula, Strain CCMP2471" /LENGTH=317 /DNA_ID=CAMNT_0007548143 /DNA_START=25 /DNA_END=975 /DNA_ORIENTATION=-